MELGRVMKRVFALSVLMIGSGVVNAEMVEFSETIVVSGEQLDVIELGFDQPGEVEVSVEDLGALSGPLSALSFAVFSSTGPITPVQEGTGVLDFFFSGEFAAIQIFAEATDYGAYRVNAEMVVPLPASLLLFGSFIGTFLMRAFVIQPPRFVYLMKSYWRRHFMA